MFRLIAVTLAALYGVLYVFGDEARRPAEVARAEPMGFGLLKAAALPFDLGSPKLHVSEISDREAVELALAAGESIREQRTVKPRLGAAATLVAANSTGASDTVSAPAYWYVTGSRVNLRGGPGTSNAVVGQVTFGAEAEVLGDADGWYQIRLADGSASGWIFGKFLDANRPG